ncbi:MAG TPA: ABC transporter ATP-binding protein/permease [Firmicutes bacterium]|nr:ABC transporter ATP-binding protein/permease [Bacillota bacterium]
MTYGSALQMLLHYAKKYWYRFVFIFFCALVAGVIDIYAPFLIGEAIDYMVSGNVYFSGIYQILLILLLLYAVQGVFKYLLQLHSAKAAHLVANRMRRAAFKHLQTLPLQYYDTTPQGDIVSRFINDADTVADGLLQGITELFFGVVIIVGTLGFMLSQSVLITVVVLAVTSLTFVVANLITRYTGKHFKRTQEITGELSGCAEEMITGYRTLRAFSYAEQAQKKFDAINTRLYGAGFRSQLGGALTNPSTRFVNHLAYISVGVIGGAAAGLTPGGISSFIIYANQFARPFNQITGVWAQILSAYAGAQRILEILNRPSEIPEDENALPLQNVRGDVSFVHVNFSYLPERPLIQDMNLQVKAGQRVAIVGPTGAGKSTVINLLMRFYDVNQGAILIDGRDIRQLKRDDLRLQFGMVLQETWCFHGTVRENIAYGRPEATEEEIIAAAKNAYAHSFIKRLEKGYDTVIGPQGGALSDGQRQLLTIARAMLMNPPMLILDEATSSIDTLTEHNITKAFQNLMEGKTSFIIAHRLSTIRNADVILVMDQGHIIEQGSHDELLQKKGFYYRLYNSQFEQVEG